MSLIFNFVNDNGQRDACELNEAFARSIQLLQDDGVTPYTLAGATARMQVRKTKGDPVVLDFATPEVEVGTPPAAIGGITVAASTGTLTLAKSVAELLAAFAGEEAVFVYDLVLTYNGQPSKILEGAFQTVQGITR